MGSCHREGYEQGPWYEIKCTQEVIRSVEARGRDASFEREILRSWSKYPGYGGAKGALASLGSGNQKA